MHTKSIGSRAEQQVAEELARQGYEIVGMNWRTPAHEIDVIAQKQGCMYFVEVKFRGTDEQGDGFDYITAKKLHQMQRAAEAWVQASGWTQEYALLAAAVDRFGVTEIIEI
jgi:putative endonuclease